LANHHDAMWVPVCWHVEFSKRLEKSRCGRSVPLLPPLIVAEMSLIIAGFAPVIAPDNSPCSPAKPQLFQTVEVEENRRKMDRAAAGTITEAGRAC
jgi:hypothetical protein